MPDLIYCHLQIFGSNFPADEFNDSIDIEGFVTHSDKKYPRSSIEAIRRGNVYTWNSERKYFCPNFSGVDVFHEYLVEEGFILELLDSYKEVETVLPRYRNETTEVYFVAVYKMSSSEKPTGVFVGNKVIEKLSKLNASLSTEVISVELHSTGQTGTSRS